MKKKNEIPYKPEETCFVICPIGKDGSEIRKKSDQVFNNIIEPAARENDLVPIRSDGITKAGIITNQIIQHIKNDKIVVADLTGLNPNVFYELALRHATFKPTVQIIQKGQDIPFDVNSVRNVEYVLDIDHLKEARDNLSSAINGCLEPNYKVESPVSVSSEISDFYSKKQPSDEKELIGTLVRQFENISLTVLDINSKISHPDFFKDVIPPHIRDQIDILFRKYADEIDLLKDIRDAGIIGIYRRREKAFRDFIHAINNEEKEIMITGSSLKGLLQNEEFKEAKEAIKIKVSSSNVRVKFLLTHPAFADFRAKQERREPTEIGKEITKSLAILNTWGVKGHDIKLYLGTPTAFAMLTSNQMLINPYSHMFQAYNSPCITVQSDHSAAHVCYFYDEFKAHHFGAWDTEMAVPISSLKTEIQTHNDKLGKYYDNIKELFGSALDKTKHNKRLKSTHR